MSYTYLQEQGAESSAECFSDIPASVLSKLNLTDGKQCSSGNETGSCRSSQSGTTCEHSTGDRGGGALMQCVGGSRAKTSAQQTPREKVLMESEAGFGVKWPEWFAKWDRDTSSWKTPQCSLFAGLDEFSEAWPRWGMMRNGECWALPMPSFLQVIRRYITTAIESSSLRCPTPTVHGNYNRKGASETSGDGLATWARKCPTPNVPNGGRRVSSGAKIGSSGLTAYWNGKKQQVGLEQWCHWAQKVPTPTAMNATGGAAMCKWGGSGARKKLKEVFTDKEINGPLNPPWVEWLMGWPEGWTDLAPLETAKFQQWLDSHGTP
jgi:hypothetical protein